MPVGDPHGCASFLYFSQFNQASGHCSQRGNEPENKQDAGHDPYALVMEYQSCEISEGGERPARNREMHQSRMQRVCHLLSQPENEAQ